MEEQQLQQRPITVQLGEGGGRRFLVTFQFHGKVHDVRRDKKHIVTQTEMC